MKQCQKSVLILLVYGASVSLGTKNQHNETPKQLAEDKEIIKLLEDPSKAREKLGQIQEWLTTKPTVSEVGRGSPVVADSPGNPSVVESVTHSNSQLSVWPIIPGLVPCVVQVSAQNFTFESNIKAEVHSGGYAAIGPGGQVNLGGSAVTDSVPSQPVSTAENTFNIKVSGGGNAAIGDHSITNVNIGTPRPPSSASSSGSTDDPWFPERSENRSNRIEGGPRCPTEDASVGALPHPIQEDKSSGNPTENPSKTPGQLPHPVPEESKKGVASGTTGELSHPVPERARPDTPTENASDSDAVNVPHSVPEQSHPRNSELVTSRNSEEWTKETRHEFSSNCDGVTTKAVEVKPGGTVDTSSTQALITAVSVTNSSVERTTVSSTAPNESSPSAYGLSTRGVGTVPVKGKINDSPGNTRTNQATGASGNQGQPKAGAFGASSHKSGIGWGQQLQKQGSKRAVALTRAAPEEIRKRLLELNCSSTSGREVPDSPLGQIADFNSAFDISSKNGYLPQAQDLWSQSATGNATEKKNTSAESDVRLSRIGLSRSPGRSLLYSQPPVGSNAGQCGTGLEHVATSRLSSLSKEAPHRKEGFLREDSSPDGGSPTVERSLEITGAAVAVEDQSANRAGVNSANRIEQQSAPRCSMNSGTRETSVVINDESEDDIGGKRRCDSQCAIM